MEGCDSKAVELRRFPILAMEFIDPSEFIFGNPPRLGIVCIAIEFIWFMLFIIPGMLILFIPIPMFIPIFIGFIPGIPIVIGFIGFMPFIGFILLLIEGTLATFPDAFLAEFDVGIRCDDDACEI